MAKGILIRESDERTALVVERDASLRRLTGTILRQDGYRVSESRTVEEAEEWMVCHRVQLLVVGMDLSGERTGMDLAVRSWERNPGMKIILTGTLGPGEQEMAVMRETGMTFLSLPCSFARLSLAAAPDASHAAAA